MRFVDELLRVVEGGKQFGLKAFEVAKGLVELREEGFLTFYQALFGGGLLCLEPSVFLKQQGMNVFTKAKVPDKYVARFHSQKVANRERSVKGRISGLGKTIGVRRGQANGLPRLDTQTIGGLPDAAGVLQLLPSPLGHAENILEVFVFDNALGGGRAPLINFVANLLIGFDGLYV